VSGEFKELCVCSQQLESNMSVVYLLLGGPDTDQKSEQYVGGIITPDHCLIFSIYDFLEKILIGNRNRTYVKWLWKTICNQNPHFMQVQGTLDLAVRSSKMPKYPPTTGTTVAGLRAVLDVLDRSHVTDANRKGLENIFARYHTGDTSMLVFVNLDDKEHPQIPRFSYNFQPPSVSNAPVASLIIQDTEAGAEEPASSRESSSTSMEFDFTSAEDHSARPSSSMLSRK
jgi:hypothetical protein